MREITEEMIDAGAKALNDDWARNGMSSTWDELAQFEKTNWRVAAFVCLHAALAEE